MKHITESLKALQAKNYKPIVKRNSKLIGKRIPDEMTWDELKKLWGRIAGPEFKYTETNKPLLNMLMAYFLQDERILEHNINPFKGILLVGKKGCGKTTIFNVFKCFLDQLGDVYFRNMVITSIDKLKQSQLITGHLDKFLYNTLPTGAPSPRELVVNELGFIYESKHYGVSFQETMINFIMLRYEIFQEYGILTHGTSNYDTSELEKIFDPMVYDRMKEMFNVIHLDGESFRS
jgi:DNA replication protein DnaC